MDMNWLSALFGDTQTPPYVPYTEEERQRLSGVSSGNPNASDNQLWVDNSTDYEKPEEEPWYYGLFGGDENDQGQNPYATAYAKSGGGGGGPGLTQFNVPQQQREKRQDTAPYMNAYLSRLMGGV